MVKSKSKGPIVVGIVATVAAHLRAFHIPWVRRLRKAGFFVIGGANGIEECEVCRREFDVVVELPFSRKTAHVCRNMRAAWKLRSVVKRKKMYMVHFHTPNAAFFGRMALRRMVLGGGVKVAYTAHGFHFYKGQRWLKRVVFRGAEAVSACATNALIVINEEDFTAAKCFRLGPGGVLRKIHGVGIDKERFDPCKYDSIQLKSALRKALGVPEREWVVAMVAEFNAGKRHRDVIEAVRIMRPREIHLVFAGVGPLEGVIREQAKNAGVGDRVHFLGYRNDIPEILASVDALVMPSEREGLPTCVMEAMCMGLPVIGANVRGIRDLVDQDCGWLYPVGDVAGLVDVLKFVTRMPDEAKKRGARARAKILRSFTWSVVEEELREVYGELGVVVK